VSILKINKINSLNTSQNVKTTSKNYKTDSQKIDNERDYCGEISNICYKPLSFGRKWEEHTSWGANIDPKTKEASFKILSYPDTKKITVTIEKNKNSQPKEYELENKGSGIFEIRNIPKGEVENGDTYFYTIYKGNGDIDKVKDPYSQRQKVLLDKSVIYDHSKYKWNDENWENNPNRISRLANAENKLTPVSSLRIYEANIATLTKSHSFDGAKKALKSIKQQGFNAIELMPVENTYSFNWGYDGVDKFAVSEYLGGPDKLKELIDEAHLLGLNVIMDIVPNHLGCDGASLKRTGPYIGGENQFGEAFNYNGENSKYVRDFIVNSALNWINNYHCDGLRLDMTKMMNSDTQMQQIASEVNYHNPHAFLIAEDGREGVQVDGDYFWADENEIHDKRVVNQLTEDESAQGESIEKHLEIIEKIENNQTALSRLGYDSEWDFAFHHELKDAIYGNIDLDTLEKHFYCSQDNVKYVVSHDEVGNFDGSRLLAKLLVPMLHLNENITLNSEDENRAKTMSQLKNQSYENALQTVKYQKAQFTAENLALLFQTGKLAKYDPSTATSKRWRDAIQEAFIQEILIPLDINPDSEITYERLNKMLQRSFNINKMALAITYSIPGPKMTFQGDESVDLTPFRFFREFESVKNEDSLYIEKGYQTGEEALNKSTFGNIPYSQEAKITMAKFRNLTRALNKINQENKALSTGRMIVEDTIKHEFSQVIATHSRDEASDNSLYTIANLSDYSYPRSDASLYYISFPKGKWQEILNTDDKKFQGTGRINLKTIESNGEDKIPIKLAGKSVAIFKKID